MKSYLESVTAGSKAESKKGEALQKAGLYDCAVTLCVRALLVMQCNAKPPPPGSNRQHSYRWISLQHGMSVVLAGMLAMENVKLCCINLTLPRCHH